MEFDDNKISNEREINMQNKEYREIWQAEKNSLQEIINKMEDYYSLLIESDEKDIYKKISSGVQKDIEKLLNIVHSTIFSDSTTKSGLTTANEISTEKISANEENNPTQARGKNINKYYQNKYRQEKNPPISQQSTHKQRNLLYNLLYKIRTNTLLRNGNTQKNTTQSSDNSPNKIIIYEVEIIRLMLNFLTHTPCQYQPSICRILSRHFEYLISLWQSI